MPYEAKKFVDLFGVKGFSDELLNNHFTLYQGYVANTNKLIDILEVLEKEDKFGTPEYNELNRRFGWEFNGMRLHEYYFANLIKGGTQLNKNSVFYKKLEENFMGSFANFEKDFKSMGAMRGLGWVILYWDKISGRFFNVWIGEHDVGHLAGAIPLLVMDVFEHAYMTDYGIKRGDYIGAFFAAIDWATVTDRYNKSGS
jgi:superoxide dismutase, Fe-Mn family